MKKISKFIASISMLLFGCLLISSKFKDLGYLNSNEFINILVVIYLVSSLYYHKLELKDKNAKIKELEIELKKTK